MDQIPGYEGIPCHQPQFDDLTKFDHSFGLNSSHTMVDTDQESRIRTIKGTMMVEADVKVGESSASLDQEATNSNPVPLNPVRKTEEQEMGVTVTKTMMTNPTSSVQVMDDRKFLSTPVWSNFSNTFSHLLFLCILSLIMVLTTILKRLFPSFKERKNGIPERRREGEESEKRKWKDFRRKMKQGNGSESRGKEQRMEEIQGTENLASRVEIKSYDPRKCHSEQNKNFLAIPSSLKNSRSREIWTMRKGVQKIHKKKLDANCDWK